MSYSKGLGIREIIKQALKEDIGKKDVTTESVISKEKPAKAVLLAKENFVVCGLDVARFVFTMLDKMVKFKPNVCEGQYIRRGEIIARIEGKAAPILTAERTALNFLSFLSGVATKTKEYADAVKPYKVKIVDTRKTIPGLRELQKYAVKIGGGYNHRMKLDEMVLIKDNHLKVIGARLKVKGQNLMWKSLSEIVQKKISKKIKVEIEVNSLKEFKEALLIKPDIIMLDNMNTNDIEKAVKIRNNLSPLTFHLLPKLEVSGGITLENVRKFAATGVDMISIGALTHSVNSVDISLEFL